MDQTNPEAMVLSSSRLSDHNRTTTSANGQDTTRPDSRGTTIHDPERSCESQTRHERGEKPILCAVCRHEVDHDEESFVGQHVSDKDDNLVDWDGPHDPAHPKQMSARRRWMIVLTTGLMTFTVSMASSIFSTTIFVTAEEFRVSSEVMILGVALYVLGLAFGPLVWGPLSEVYGRTRPLFTGMAVFVILQIPVGVAQTLETIFICRFLAGIAGSSPLAIIAGMYVDFMETLERGMATAVYAGATFAGPAAGPVIGSFITQSHLGWRWTAWITMIMATLFTFLAWITTPETFEPTLLKRKAESLRHERKDWSLHAKSEEHKVDMRALLTKYLTKPMYMIVLEPIVSL